MKVIYRYNDIGRLGFEKDEKNMNQKKRRTKKIEELRFESSLPLNWVAMVYLGRLKHYIYIEYNPFETFFSSKIYKMVQGYRKKKRM